MDEYQWIEIAANVEHLRIAANVEHLRIAADVGMIAEMLNLAACGKIETSTSCWNIVVGIKVCSCVKKAS
jgi:hypothetical protein